MRKLFVVGIVSVVILTAWLFILNRDIERFKRELSVGPVLQQGSNKEFVQNENTHELLGIKNVETSIQSTESLESVHVRSPNITNTDKDDTASEVLPIDAQQTLTDTELSLKLKNLFTTYRSLNKEMTYNTDQLLPLQNECSLLEDRKREILDIILSGAPDVATIDALHEELDVIHAWRKENLPSMFVLQNKVKQIDEKQLANLKEYGFSSFEEFWNTHGKTYETWESDQTNKF